MPACKGRTKVVAALCPARNSIALPRRSGAGDIDFMGYGPKAVNLASLFAALADPIRLRLLNLMAGRNDRRRHGVITLRLAV